MSGESTHHESKGTCASMWAQQLTPVTQLWEELASQFSWNSQPLMQRSWLSEEGTRQPPLVSSGIPVHTLSHKLTQNCGMPYTQSYGSQKSQGKSFMAWLLGYGIKTGNHREEIENVPVSNFTLYIEGPYVKSEKTWEGVLSHCWFTPRKIKGTLATQRHETI